MFCNNKQSYSHGETDEIMNEVEDILKETNYYQLIIFINIIIHQPTRVISSSMTIINCLTQNPLGRITASTVLDFT